MAKPISIFAMMRIIICVLLVHAYIVGNLLFHRPRCNVLITVSDERYVMEAIDTLHMFSWACSEVTLNTICKEGPYTHCNVKQTMANVGLECGSILKYLASYGLQKYDWFIRVTESVYMRKSKLNRLHHIAYMVFLDRTGLWPSKYAAGKMWSKAHLAEYDWRVPASYVGDVGIKYNLTLESRVSPYGAWYEGNFGRLPNKRIFTKGIFGAKTMYMRQDIGFFNKLYMQVNYTVAPEECYYMEQTWHDILIKDEYALYH